MPSPPGPAGLLVVDKPAGLTSHDVVGRVRRLAGTRKVGHAGTLDPMATGVLLVGVNRATRLLGHLVPGEKRYDATMRLGTSTTTDDATGETVSRTSAAEVTEAAVRAALAGFVGDIEQVPSSVSAVKVDGRRAYARVRAGERVDLAARRVHVAAIDVHTVRRTGETLDADVSVTCSSGTYVRALARDLGRHLGVGGHLTTLRRTAVGPFSCAEARSLDRLAGSLDLMSLDVVAARCFPPFTLTSPQAGAVAVGRSLDVDLGSPGPVALFAPDGGFLALYERRGDLAVPVAVFTG